MGRIHVLSEDVANKIAAGEVVERPASVVKELLENSLDAGAQRIRLHVEAGGKKLIQIVDDGQGMLHDDALLAFERHATSKLRTADDLVRIGTLGFRGEALPSIASVSRLRLETRSEEEPGGTVIEIAGGRFMKVEEAGLPVGTSITVRDLFFNTPARKKFLKAEQTELSHIASLVTHYALAHPDKHFELHSATNAMLIAAPVASHGDRIYQVFGQDTLHDLVPVAAEFPLARIGLPQPPPWARARIDAEREKYGEDFEEPANAGEPGVMRLHGYVSKPEMQKLNRNSIFVFVNGRLIRDRLVQHALTEAYRNIIPPTVYPVVLLFLELPFTEVDVNVHPSKTEVRFRQQSAVHDFVRESVRAALMKARPVPQFTREITAEPKASPHFTPGGRWLQHAAETQNAVAVGELGITADDVTAENDAFTLRAPTVPPMPQRLEFGDDAIEVQANAAVPVARFAPMTFAPRRGCGGEIPDFPERDYTIEKPLLATLKPVGQVRNSFILAVNEDGLWIVDQHVAHERILFERVLRQRATTGVEGQRMLMPLVIELLPAQQAMFAEIAEELRRNGFEIEPFGSRSIAVKTAPAGVDSTDVEKLLQELLDQFVREEQLLNMDKIRAEIAASIACHAAIKVNTPLAHDKMQWLIQELSRTDCPMACPHGRPVVLRYSVRDIQRAFKRI
jgi:DNA mismatch repair protein MutL